MAVTIMRRPTSRGLYIDEDAYGVHIEIRNFTAPYLTYAYILLSCSEYCIGG